MRKPSEHRADDLPATRSQRLRALHERVRSAAERSRDAARRSTTATFRHPGSSRR